MKTKKILIAVSLLFFSGLMVAKNNLNHFTDTTIAKEGKGVIDIPFVPKAEIGLRFMPTFSSIKVQTSDGGKITGDLTLNYGIGAMLAGYLNNHIGVQVDVIYNSFSQKYKDLDLSRKIKISYVNVPLLLSLNTRKSNTVNFNLVFGPQFGFNVGSTLQTTGSNGTHDTQAVLAVKKNDIDFAYGAGLDFGINSARTIRIGIGYRGVLGLMDIADNNKSIAANEYYVLNNSKITTNSGYLGISFLF